MTLRELKNGYSDKASKLETILNEADIELKELHAFNEILKKDFFDIAFIGEFTSGKSTMINALLGDAILPTNLQASTARVTTISYSKEPRIVLNLTDGKTENVEYSSEFINSLVANNPSKLENIESIELYYPSDLLRDGIRFIDTPGTNDTDKQRVEITYKLIPSVDAIVYVSIYPVTASNLDVFKTLILDNGIVNRFIILNKADLFQYGNEGIDDATQLFEELTQESKVKLYPVSSFDYLEGILDKDKRLIEKSKFPQFLSDLDKFIQSSEKFENLSKQLNYKFNAFKNQANELIDITQKSLVMPDDVFQERKEQFLSKLRKYRNDSEQIKRDIHTEFERLNNKLYSSLDKLMIDIIQGVDLMLDQQGTDIPILLKQIEYSIKSKYEMWQNKNRGHINRFIESISKEIDIRLGQVAHNINVSIIKFSEEDTSAKLTSTSNNENLNQMDDRKKSVALGVASVGVYAGLASAGLALAPIAMLIMPIGMFMMQKVKREKMALLKEEVIKELQQKGVAFKNDVLKSIMKTEENLVGETNQRFDSFTREIEIQIDKVEIEREGMKSDLEKKANHLKSLNKQILAI